MVYTQILPRFKTLTYVLWRISVLSSQTLKPQKMYKNFCFVECPIIWYMSVQMPVFLDKSN